MYSVVLMVALAGSGQQAGTGIGLAGCGYGNGFGFGNGYPYGGVYEHGYGRARPVTWGCCGIVLPPAWPADPTPRHEWKTWFDYVAELEGHEKDEMTEVWYKATPEARKILLADLTELRAEAARYRAKVQAERDKFLNRPLTDEELQVWKNYSDKLKGEKKQDALDKWKKLSNKEKRAWLRDIQRMEE